MAYFIVSYDLVKENSSHDYKPLWDALNKMDSVNCHRSVYLVAKDTTAAALYNQLVKLVDENDRLIVAEFYAKPSWGPKALQGTSAWLKTHFG
jgi:hypothetical protein